MCYESVESEAVMEVRKEESRVLDPPTPESGFSIFGVAVQTRFLATNTIL